MNFFDKLSQAIAQNQSLLFVGLDPNPEMMPARYASSDIISSLWDWLQFIIAETAEQVCVYKPTLGFYQALGIPGLELLQKLYSLSPLTFQLF